MNGEGIQETRKDTLRAIFGRGIVILVPVVITVWVLNTLFNAVDGIISPVFDKVLGNHIPGLGLVSMLILIFLIGILSRNLFGQAIFKFFERILSSIPLARTIYGAMKDMTHAFAPGGKGKSFRQVVVIEYPSKGLLTIGFVTNEITLQGNMPSDDMVSVYILNPPNPTSGLLVLVPRTEVRTLNMSVEEGLRFVLSGGIATTGLLTIKEGRE